MTSSHPTSDRADIDALCSDKYLLMSELAAAGCSPKERGHFPCPFHNEKTASCHIDEENGRWFFKCFGCGKGGDVINARAFRNRCDAKQATKELLTEYRRLTPEDKARRAAAGKAQAQQKKPPRVYKTREELEQAVIGAVKYYNDKVQIDHIEIKNRYDYTTIENRLALVVYRVEFYVGGERKKHFMQAHTTDAGFILRRPEGRMPLYNLSGIEKSSWVVYVEGEKACEALMKLRFPATCAAGGSKAKLDLIDFTPLSGKKVYFWPDFDPVDEKTGERGGFTYMENVIRECLKLDNMPDCFWCDPENAGLEDKDDAYDFIEQMKSLKLLDQQNAVTAFLSTAKIRGDAALIDTYLEKVFSGQLRPISMPWPKLQDMTRALIPGKILIICGAAGATKSIMGLQLMIHILFEEKKRVAILMLEDSKEEHLMRGLAIKCRTGPLTRTEWCEQHRDIVIKCKNDNNRFLNELGRCLDVRSDKTIPPEMILDFILNAARSGARVVYIDPVTMMEVGDKQWVADLAFLIKAKAICTEYGIVLVLVTHPKTGSNEKKGIDFMAGGQSYVRFSHSIIWLEAMAEEERAEFKPLLGPTISGTYNRLAWVMKARNSYGAKKACGFYFDGSTFEAQELGQLIEEKKDDK